MERNSGNTQNILFLEYLYGSSNGQEQYVRKDCGSYAWVSKKYGN